VTDQSLYPDDAFNMETSNRHIIIIPQIESVKGVENMEEIASIPEISGLMLGPADYMTDAGLKLRFDKPHPQLLATMAKMTEVAKKHNLSLMGCGFLFPISSFSFSFYLFTFLFPCLWPRLTDSAAQRRPSSRNVACTCGKRVPHHCRRL